MVNTKNHSPNIYYGCFLLITLQADALVITAWVKNDVLVNNPHLISYTICFINVDITHKPLYCSLKDCVKPVCSVLTLTQVVRVLKVF